MLLQVLITNLVPDIRCRDSLELTVCSYACNLTRLSYSCASKRNAGSNLPREKI